ncbi:MAG: arginine decarboxylase, pyruvoyl-dependent [Phycisphaerae bacterium]|nr:arginine decarboxylase, pyruvoyl-dependent [Phycisphaerae bacterium]
MFAPVASKMFFTRGVGRHRHNLESFEAALRDAGIAHLNLVRVSSIFPPQCKIVSRRVGVTYLRPGQITFVVMAEARTNEPNRLVSAGIGLAVPADGDHFGYIAEHHGYGMNERRTADFVEDMAASMLASTQGIEFDPDADYDKRREIYRMSGKIVKTRATVQTAEGDKKGLWTSVVAAAVMLFDESGPAEAEKKPRKRR